MNTPNDLSEDSDASGTDVFGTEKKKKNIDEIAEEIDYEYPDIP